MLGMTGGARAVGSKARRWAAGRAGGKRVTLGGTEVYECAREHLRLHPSRERAERHVLRGRSTGIAAVAAVLLSLPFFVYGVMTLDTKARVELKCAPNGPCTLTRESLLSKEEVGVFPLEELRGAKVERNRKSRTRDESVWRPVLETTRGDFPLSHGWMSEERKAQSTAGVVQRYLGMPFAGGVTLWHDDRAGAGRMGTAFIVVGGLLVLMSGWLAFKARRLLRAERAARGA